MCECPCGVRVPARGPPGRRISGRRAESQWNGPRRESQVNDGVTSLLKLAEGPVFRAAFALLLLGGLRALLLAISDTGAAYSTTPSKPAFWHKLRMRWLWLVFPTLVDWRDRYQERMGLFAYHMILCCASLVFRLGLILVPTFMVAHVYLWERGLGTAWLALPGAVADTLAMVTIVAGAVLFLGRMYSPLLRYFEPGWTFFKPLILLVPFITGYLAMHPTWSPLDYHVVRLVHILSASVVFALAPFTRMLTCVHTPITRVVPAAAWDALVDSYAPGVSAQPERVLR